MKYYRPSETVPDTKRWHDRQDAVSHAAYSHEPILPVLLEQHRATLDVHLQSKNGHGLIEAAKMIAATWGYREGDDD